MKPYISGIITRNGKTYKLPIPSKYRELLECARILGLKTEADEEDLRVIGYETLMYIPAPRLLDSISEVEVVAEKISQLSTEQVRLISEICEAFNVEYINIGNIIDCIKDNTGGKW